MSSLHNWQISLDITCRIGGEHGFVLQPCLQSRHRHIALLGPSGAGKSLTLQAVAGLLVPDCGHIKVAEKFVFNADAGINLPPRARRVGYLFQDYALFPHLSVRQNILFGLGLAWFGSRRQTLPATASRWVESFGLEALLDRYPDQVSGGQRQRVALARALVTQPELLLLDEPLSALDASLRTSMRRELAELQQDIGIPTLLVSHDANDVAALANEVFIMQNGKIRQHAELSGPMNRRLEQVTELAQAMID